MDWVGKITAIEALNKGLKDLVDLCTHVEDTMRIKVDEFDKSKKSEAKR